MNKPNSPPSRPPDRPDAPEPPSNVGRLARLRARFDSSLLTAPSAAGLQAPPAAPPACVDAALLQQALATLCAGPAGFASARHPLAPGAAQQAQQLNWLNHQLLHLDGTWHLQQLGGPWRQRLHRLAVKLREVAAAGAVPGGPWDCGFVNGGTDVAAHADAFKPRRATLMVAWQLPPATLLPLQAALQARHGHGGGLPVRLWVLQALVSP